MPLLIEGLEFQGPALSYKTLPDEAGIYVIINPSLADEQIIDVGEASCLRERLARHERKNAWRRCSKMIFYAVFPTPGMSGLDRRRLVRMIRDNHQGIPCDIGMDPQTGELIVPESAKN